MLSNFNVFDEWTYRSLIELISQNTNMFNSASRNTIVLRGASNTGDFKDVSRWKSIDGLVVNRDPYANIPLTVEDMSQSLETTVKVGAGSKPVNISRYLLEWINRNPREAGLRHGEDLAAQMMATTQ
jgi:hypothetical protein